MPLVAFLVPLESPYTHPPSLLQSWIVLASLAAQVIIEDYLHLKYLTPKLAE